MRVYDLFVISLLHSSIISSYYRRVNEANLCYTTSQAFEL